MHLLDLFESTNEGYTVTRGIDRDRYQERAGLEGPFQTKSGKVVYYDKKEGKYYDPDSDMYIDHDDYAELDESKLAEMFESSYGAPLFDNEGEISSNKRTERILGLLRAKNPTAQNDLEALIMSFDKGQKQDRDDINTLYSQNRDEDREIEELERELEALKKRRSVREENNKERAERAATDKVKAMIAQKQADAAKQPKAKQKPAPKDSHSDKSTIWKKGYADGKAGRMDPRASDAYGPRTGEYEAGYAAGSKVNEDYYDTDEQRELARLGRIIMDIGAKRDDDIGAAMGAVGMELTKYGTPQGVNNIQKLEKVTGQPESVIMKMMALAQKVQGDVAVGADVEDDEEIEEADFDTNFKKRVGATVRGGSGAEYMKKKAKERQAQNKELDPAADRKGLGIGVLDAEKAREKMAKRGVKPPRAGFRTSPRTQDPKRLPEQAESPMVSLTVPNVTFDMAQKLERLAKENNVEYSRKGRTVVLKGRRIDMTTITTKMGLAQTNLKMEPMAEALDHDIKIGDTVETKKMGQMQGTVTGFSTKYGDTRVMFKHKSGKVYATPASNLKVIDTAKKTESLDDTVVEAKKKPVPTDPSKWSYYKSQAKKKFDVYPSAYANAWAAKQYKAAGGGWRMGKPKK